MKKVLEDKYHKFSIKEKTFFYDILYGNLYDNLEELEGENKNLENIRSEFKIDKTKLTPENFSLQTIALHVSNDCNLRCTYCFGDGGSYGQNRDYMSEEIAEKAIDMLITNSGNSKEITVVFFGGEPLMNFGLMKKVVEYCKAKEIENDKKIKYSMTTNGTLIDTDEMLEFIRRNEVSVTISIDGTKEVHDKYRIYPNGSGSFDKMMNGVNKLLEKNNEKVSARITLGEEALELHKIMNDVANLGFKQVNIALASGSEDNSSSIKRSSTDMIFNEYLKCANEFLETLKKGEPYSKLNLFYQDIKKIHKKFPKYYFCGVGKGYLSVMPDGNIYICHRFAGNLDYTIGNLKNGIDNIVKKKIIDLHVDNKDKCYECWARYLCGGGCYYNSEIIGSSNENDVEPNCDLTRKYYELCLYLYNEMKKDNSNYWDEEFAREKWRKKLGVI